MAQVRNAPVQRAVGEVIVDVVHVDKDFTTPDGQPLRVLEDINFQLREGEIVALLGKSGSGKSTLLRCIAGLIAPTEGTVSYRGVPVNGANPGVAMVFQSFALLPWLTVQANAEMGLEARGVPEAERHQRALKMIDLIGLDGFEQAYPEGTLRRHASAGRLRPRPRRRTRRPPDGRAVQCARRPHRREPTHRAAQPLAGRGLPHQGHPHRHPQHRRGGPDGRPHLRAHLQPGPVPERDPESSSPAPQPPVAGVRSARRPDLRDHDRPGHRRARVFPRRRSNRPWRRRPSSRCPTPAWAAWPV